MVVAEVAGADVMLGGGRRARAALTPALALLAHLPLLHGWGSSAGLRAPWAHPVLGRRPPSLGPGVSLYAARGHHPPSKRTPPPPPPKRLPTASNPFDISDELKSQEVIEKEEWEVKKGRCAPPPPCTTARVRGRGQIHGARHVRPGAPRAWCAASGLVADGPRVRAGPRRAVEQRFTRTNGTMTTATSCRATASSITTPRWKYTHTDTHTHTQLYIPTYMHSYVYVKTRSKHSGEDVIINMSFS